MVDDERTHDHRAERSCLRVIAKHGPYVGQDPSPHEDMLMFGDQVDRTRTVHEGRLRRDLVNQSSKLLLLILRDLEVGDSLMSLPSSAALHRERCAPRDTSASAMLRASRSARSGHNSRIAVATAVGDASAGRVSRASNRRVGSSAASRRRSVLSALRCRTGTCISAIPHRPSHPKLRSPAIHFLADVLHGTERLEL